MYIGPANGGVWKSTDAGITWIPLTDQQVSLSMGAIEIDPNNQVLFMPEPAKQLTVGAHIMEEGY